MGMLSTHVLDTSLGVPAAGVGAVLENSDGEVVGFGITDPDGRIGTIGAGTLDAGDYRLRFSTGDYFKTVGVEAFYPEVIIVFTVADSGQHYHVPLLLSPYGFSTYRGS
jgi:5-hydroxyisourate hydrolase